MKSQAGIISLLLGVALLPGELAAGEERSAAQPPKTRVHRQLNQMLRDEAVFTVPVVASEEAEPATVAPGTLQLEPMIVEEPKLKDLPPPETRAEKFFRTGTIWERVGPKFTQRFWLDGSRGLCFTLAW